MDVFIYVPQVSRIHAVAALLGLNTPVHVVVGHFCLDKVLNRGVEGIGDRWSPAQDPQPLVCPEPSLCAVVYDSIVSVVCEEDVVVVLLALKLVIFEGVKVHDALPFVVAVGLTFGIHVLEEVVPIPSTVLDTNIVASICVLSGCAIAHKFSGRILVTLDLIPLSDVKRLEEEGKGGESGARLEEGECCLRR